MLSPSRALGHAALLALALISTPAALAAPAAPPAIESFFANQKFGGAKLAPDGRSIAALSSAPGQRDFLVVIDLQTNQAKVVGSYDDADIAEFRWVNNQRLLFNVIDNTAGPGDSMYAPGLFAVNRDGSQLVQLAARDRADVTHTRTTERKMLPWNTYLMDQAGAQDSDDIYVENPVWDSAFHNIDHTNLVRLNTITGRSQQVPRPPGKVKGWMLDHKGEPRIANTFEEDTVTLHYRDPASGAWRVLTSYRAYGDGRHTVTPVAFGPDGTLYVEARSNTDTSALHTFDLATGKVNPTPVLVTKGYDFDGDLIVDQQRTLGVRFTTDAESIEWLDPGMRAIQETVDKLLPATINLITVARRAATPWLLVRAYSDAIPATYWLYNKETKLLNKVGETRPGIDPLRMGRQQFIRYKARDGLEIPALLTLPPGPNRTLLPLVMLVHGGPYVRGSSWGWHTDSQFLASRGYAVLEPEFRGSTGFGTAHFKAGWKQWGLGMQNDVADGARWAIAKGLVDPNRVCIAGASYGGYATLMGLVNDPDLYKCGVNWVGVSDINLMYGDSWSFTSDLSDEWKKYGMPELIGDPVKDAAQLQATSPIAQAARIKQPLLMAYGGVDRRVPLHHGKKFLDAVSGTNKQVEWIEYPEEGHGWYLPKNRIDFWTRVEKFLDKHIGTAAAKGK